MNQPAVKIFYALLAIFLGLTLGVLVAALAGVCSAIEMFLRFPFQFYYGAVSSARVRRLNQAFNVQTMEDLERQRLDAMTEDEKMWERHIQKMEKKKHNN